MEKDGGKDDMSLEQLEAQAKQKEAEKVVRDAARASTEKKAFKWRIAELEAEEEAAKRPKIDNGTGSGSSAVASVGGGQSTSSGTTEGAAEPATALSKGAASAPARPCWRRRESASGSDRSRSWRSKSGSWME
jgi:hypothetical protein